MTASVASKGVFLASNVNIYLNQSVSVFSLDNNCLTAVIDTIATILGIFRKKGAVVVVLNQIVDRISSQFSISFNILVTIFENCSITENTTPATLLLTQANLLENALQNGNLTATLHFFASSLGATALLTTTADSVTIMINSTTSQKNLNPSSSSSSTSSSSHLNGQMITLIVVLSFILATLFVSCYFLVVGYCYFGRARSSHSFNLFGCSHPSTHVEALPQADVELQGVCREVYEELTSVGTAVEDCPTILETALMTPQAISVSVCTG